jgi:hypothetical protein
MKARKYTEVRLNPRDENLVFTILDLAGWHEGRRVDIEEIERHYKSNHCPLSEMAKAFFREFYGLPGQFCFKCRYPTQDKWSVGGHELAFDTSVSNELFEFEDEEDRRDFETGKSLVARHEPDGCTPVADCGFHLGGTLWVGHSGKIYRTYYYARDTIECYDSIIQMFEHDLGQYRGAEELFVSFGGYAKEWGVGGDFYLKEYLKEYGE